MTTVAKFVDLEKFSSTIKDFRADNGSINWILVGHVDGNPSLVDIVETGSGGPDELVTKLNDESVQYCITKVTDTIDNTKMFKFVYIHWVGQNVPFVKVGRLGVVHGSIQKLFEPHHDYIETSNSDDLSELVLSTRVSETSGSKSKVVEGELPEGRRVDRFMRGTAYRMMSQDQSEKNRPRTSTYGGSAPDSCALKISDCAISAIKSLKSGVSENDWCLVTYEDSRCKGPLIFYKSGNNGISELKGNLTTNKAYYGVVQLKQTVDSTVTAVKFVSVTYVGPDIPHMARAQLGTHSSVVEGLIGSCHGKIYTNNLNELTENELRKKID